ncbi:holin family protein [Loktanella sp. DJP18]|uniref:holin family protein n=1 Tax=Loktanella sp. DJP18 TaxID=3409788 RepID=UPI003BB68626
MGLMSKVLGWVVGGGGGALVQTVEALRENSEKGGARISDEKIAALAQFAAEFQGARPGLFDRMIDGLNRLPRPMLAFGTLGLFVSAMVSPAWFSSRMVGVALIPEPLWWLMGAIVSFYFGSRYQAKGQEFQRSVHETVLMGQALVADKVNDEPEAPVLTRTSRDADAFADNAALADWWGQARAE